MPEYTYKATDSKDKLVKGTITAKTEREVESYLTDKHLKALTINTEKKSGFKRGGSFPLTDKITICRYLSLIINAGISLSEGLDMLANGTNNKTVHRVLEDVAGAVRRGSSLHQAFSSYQSFFGDIFLTMVKTGETSGTLANSFAYLSHQYSKEKDLRQKVLGALLYPIIIVGLMVVVGIMVFAFVLPRLAKVFSKMNVEFPFYTKLLFDFSLFLESHLILAGILLLALLVGAGLFFKMKVGKDILFSLIVHTPGIKRVILEYNLVRFTQSLSSLFKSGVPVTEAVELSIHSLSFVKKEKLTKEVTGKLMRGVTIATAFSEAKLFPPLMIQMISVGEKTGSLDKTLADLGEFYEQEVENSLKNFVTILEPMIMIVVGIAVGVMVISIISPIYSLIGKLQTGT